MLEDCLSVQRRTKGPVRDLLEERDRNAPVVVVGRFNEKSFEACLCEFVLPRMSRTSRLQLGGGYPLYLRRLGQAVTMSKGLKESGNYPRLRKERRPAAHVSCMDASRVLLARQFSDSELSEASNHYLQETSLLPEIDPATRLDIERRFQKSSINASYVFPRVSEEPKPLLRTAERKSRQHKPSNSVTEAREPGLVRKK